MISVIIPLYNKEAIIERTLRSVLSQDYDDYEVVIVDDGSTDKSLSVVERELPKIKRELNVNTNVELIQQENGGPSKARNTGVKHAKGEWLLFLDADDELLPDALKKMCAIALNHSDADVIDCSMSLKIKNRIRNHQKTFTGYSKNPLKDLFYARIEPGSNETLFRKSLCLKYPYNETYRRYEDMEFVIRALKDAVVFSSQEIVAYVNIEYASASHARRDVRDDYIGHLKFEGSFWQKMIQYKMYLGEREYYKEECDSLYPSLKWRYDILLLYKLLNLFR